MKRLTIVLAALVLGLGSCAKVDYVAPNSSKLSLTINPLVIAAQGGTAQVVATGTKSSGYPLPDGTHVTFTTNLGVITPEAETSGGSAYATLTASGVGGEATVKAYSGNVASNEIKVTIGVPASTVTLNGTPASLPLTGGTVNLVAVVFGTNGTPVSGGAVTFSTTNGTLASGGSTVYTDAQGEARDTLNTDKTATVTVQAGGSGASAGPKATLSIPVATQDVTSIVLSANPTTLASTGTSSLLATVFGSIGPVSGIPVVFKTTAGTLANTGVIVTDVNGGAANSITTDASATITVSAGSKTDTVTVTVGGGTVYIRLSATRTSITDTALADTPGPAFCTAQNEAPPTSANPQLPIDLYAQVTDASGAPLANRQVLFFFDFSLIDNCARMFGQFCGSGSTSVTGITGADGVATARLGITDTDFKQCFDWATPATKLCCENCGLSTERDVFCQDGITATSGQTTSDPFNQIIIEWAQ